jgi:hypothetical protein
MCIAKPLKFRQGGVVSVPLCEKAVMAIIVLSR